MEKPCFVYILYSESFDKYYIGATYDIIDRLDRHNKGLETYSKKYRPWKLIWKTQKNSKSDAFILEKKLKNLSRARLMSFMEKYNEGFEPRR